MAKASLCCILKRVLISWIGPGKNLKNTSLEQLCASFFRKQLHDLNKRDDNRSWGGASDKRCSSKSNSVVS